MSLEFPNLPDPEIIDASTFEDIFARKLAKFQTDYPDYANVVEGDPVYALLQDSAYDELNIRQQINNAYRQTLILHASGTNLDNLVYNVALTRQVKADAVFDADGVLVTPEVLETDDQLRRRYLLAWHALGLGTEGWYTFHALNSDVNVKDAYPNRTADGEVTVYIQSEGDGGGVPTQALLDAVETYLNARDRRVLGDTLVIAGITAVNYTITAEITVPNELDSTTIQEQVQAAAEAFAEESEVIGESIPLSRFYAVLSPDGVSGVTLTSPTADVTVTDIQVPVATSITVTVA